jgi:hypothetical protein
VKARRLQVFAAIVALLGVAVLAANIVTATNAERLSDQTAARQRDVALALVAHAVYRDCRTRNALARAQDRKWRGTSNRLLVLANAPGYEQLDAGLTALAEYLRPALPKERCLQLPAVRAARSQHLDFLHPSAELE